MRAALILISSLMTACVPWTVVPTEDEATESAADPAAYVESIWDSRLLPEARRNAIELSKAKQLHEQGKGAHFLVKGHARALSLDIRSRNGRLLLDLPPYDRQADAALLVGPAILGTAVRDAAGFIEFTDFANQLVYADVGNELNRRVMAEVIGPLDLHALPGRSVSFLGAWTAGSGATPEIVPLEVTIE